MKLLNRFALAWMLLLALLFVTWSTATLFALESQSTPVAVPGGTETFGLETSAGLCDLTVNVVGTGSVDVVRTNVDPELSVELDSQLRYLVMENSQIYVRFEEYVDTDGTAQFSIRDFKLKENDIDQAGTYLDAGFGRGALVGAELIYDGGDRKTVRLDWLTKPNSPNVPPNIKLTTEVSIYPNARFLKLDYVRVDWAVVIVDLAAPGGVSNAQPVAYGSENWKRGFIAHPKYYYTRLPEHAEEYGDPEDGGALNYNGHFIVGLFNPDNQVGYGRTLPIARTRAFKILSSSTSRQGFEIFTPQPAYLETYTSFLFAVTDGAAEIIEQGKRLVDATAEDFGYQCGEEVELTAVPGSGWYFTNWSGDVSSTNETIALTLTGRHAVNANFGSDLYALNVSLVPADGSGGTVTRSPDKVSYQYGEVVDLTAVPRPGWTFQGWSGALSGSAPTGSLTMTTDRDVTATFTQDQYVLTTEVIGNGAISRQPDKPTYTYDEIVILTAVPDPGWSFAGWEGAASGNPVAVQIKGDTAVAATFTQDQYAITLATEGPGTLQMTPVKETYVYGDVVVLTATPNAGKYFAGWHGDLSGSANPREVIVQGNMAIVATFSSTPPNTFLPMILRAN